MLDSVKRAILYLTTLFLDFTRTLSDNILKCVTSYPGSATSVFCALSPDVVAQSGAHYADCRVETKIIHPTASDAQLAADLWKASEEIVKA